MGGGFTTTTGVGGFTSSTTGVGGGFTTTTTGVGGGFTTTTVGVGGSSTVTTSGTTSSGTTMTCAPTCEDNADCQDSYPVPQHGIYCCDVQTNQCYHRHHYTCPATGTGGSSSASTSSGY